MLSICIPVFNTDTRELVTELHRQAETLGSETEIFLLDDGSNEKTRQTNRAFTGQLTRVRYEELPDNTGRSRVRNLLARQARYPILLFLDGDMQVEDPLFLKNYLNLAPAYPVVCGGHVYQSDPPAREHMLHWKAGRNREILPASKRNKTPHKSFMTANFSIRREIFKRVEFSESLNGYGHEDTLFGYQLQRQRIPVFHTDNPALHAGLEPAHKFLEKTRQAMKNLLAIEAMLQGDPEFTGMVRVLRSRHQLGRFGLTGLYRQLFLACKSRMEKNLMGDKPKLHILDLYKLGLLIRASQE